MFLLVTFSVAWFDAHHKGLFLSLFFCNLDLFVDLACTSKDFRAAHVSIELSGVLRAVCHACVLRTVCHAWHAFKPIIGRELYKFCLVGSLFCSREALSLIHI